MGGLKRNSHEKARGAGADPAGTPFIAGRRRARRRVDPDGPDAVVAALRRRPVRGPIRACAAHARRAGFQGADALQLRYGPPPPVPVQLHGNELGRVGAFATGAGSSQIEQPEPAGQNAKTEQCDELIWIVISRVSIGSTLSSLTGPAAVLAMYWTRAPT